MSKARRSSRQKSRPSCRKPSSQRAGAGATSIRAMTDAEQIGVRCGGRFSAYPEVFEHALRAARGLNDLGVEAGDRVALLLHNSIEFLEGPVATAPLGAGAVPINWHWRADEIAHVLSDSAAKVLIVHADLWPAIAAAVPAGVQIVVVPSDADG